MSLYAGALKYCMTILINIYDISAPLKLKSNFKNNGKVETSSREWKEVETGSREWKEVEKVERSGMVELSGKKWNGGNKWKKVKTQS